MKQRIYANRQKNCATIVFLADKKNQKLKGLSTGQKEYQRNDNRNDLQVQD
jgi:hypothetical protein